MSLICTGTLITSYCIIHRQGTRTLKCQNVSVLLLFTLMLDFASTFFVDFCVIQPWQTWSVAITMYKYRWEFSFLALFWSLHNASFVLLTFIGPASSNVAFWLSWRLLQPLWLLFSLKQLFHCNIDVSFLFFSSAFYYINYIGSSHVVHWCHVHRVPGDIFSLKVFQCSCTMGLQGILYCLKSV